MASAWLRRNVRQVCDGGPRRRIMYLETVDSAIWKPSFSNSPWMRRAPHSGFSVLIRRMSSRTSRTTRGRPGRPRDFQRQYVRNPARCQRRIVAGWTTRDKPSRLGQSQVIHTNNARSLPRSCRLGCTPQGNIELMPKKDILKLKSAPRLEQVGDNCPKQMEHRNHRVDDELILPYRANRADGIFGNDSCANVQLDAPIF